MGYAMKVVVSNIDNWLMYLDTDIPQTEGALCNINTDATIKGFCCIGVATQFVLNLEFCELSDTREYIFKGDESEGSFPGTAYNAFGLWDESGSRCHDNGTLQEMFIWARHAVKYTDSLVKLNDKGQTFKQIRNVLLVDLRTDELGFFRPPVRKAWRKHHGFTY